MTTKDAMRQLRDVNETDFDRLICIRQCPGAWGLSGGQFEEKCPCSINASADFRPPFCKECWAAALEG